jgi:hypothetical protein
MIAQLFLSVLLGGVLLYAWAEYRRSPVVAIMAMLAALIGFDFVWFPAHSTQIASLAGIGRGVDLVLYVWVCITLILLLNLHLKLRTQMEVVTALAREVALATAASAERTSVPERLGEPVAPPLTPAADERAAETPRPSRAGKRARRGARNAIAHKT